MKLCLLSILLLMLLVDTAHNIHIPRHIPFFAYKDFDADFYTLVDKQVTAKSFKFILHYAHNVRYGKMKKVVDLAEYISLEVFVISKDTVQFIFRSANETRFELPCEEPFPCHLYPENLVTDLNMNNLEYDYELIIKERPFSFTLKRKTTKEILFTTLNRHVVFKENYAEISTDLPSDNLFGFGERTTTFKLKSGIYTLYNKDLYGELEDGKGEGKNRYGSHPMYLMRERSGNYHISYLRNSFPMDVLVDHQTSVLAYKVAGGVLDFTFFLGDENPENVTKMYHKFLRGYSLPPFWALGFHQCRWGYKNLGMINDVLKSYEQNKLPLDTVWTDIDYMKDYMPFTVDSDRFNLQEFNKTLSENKKKYILIIEPSMGTKWPNFEYLTEAKKLDIFIKTKLGDYLINKVWPGKCHFFDYFNPATKPYWENALTKLHEKLGYSGIWLDMNEIAAFEPGQMDMYDDTLPCDDDNHYPYTPGSKPFETATICPNAVHYNNMTHIQVHNYYPNMQAKLTYEFLEKMKPNEYPFILTRANAAGIGRYAAHWSGDNYGRFSFYKLSIAEILNFNLFGAPMTGADICGFGENTPEVLCAKWYQMGSLYPFSRSHAHLDSYRKEPFAMGSILLETTKKSLQFRYSILKYYYSLFMLNNGAGTIFRPLFFEFYKDPACLDNAFIDNFFMIGSALLAVPNLHDNDETISTPAYFPKGDWFDLRYNTRVNKRNSDPQLVTVETPLNEAPAVFLRSGKTIFTNDINDVRNSYDLDNTFDILIAVEKDESGDKSKGTSQGVIPALNDYNSKKDVDHCMKLNCFINVSTIVKYENENKSMVQNNNDTIYALNEASGRIINISIKFSEAKYYNDEFIQIKVRRFVIFGVNITSAAKLESKGNNNNNNNENNQFELKRVNESCFIIEMREALVIRRGESIINFSVIQS